MKPGSPEKREFEYIRHGTRCLLAAMDVASGQLLTAHVRATRTEADFVDLVAATVATAPTERWFLVMDNLNTHQSATLVTWVAEQLELDLDLGQKGQFGILKDMQSRRDFLSDPDHRICFIYTPKHCSWLNQIELWFSILVRRLLGRATFRTTDELRERILAFVDFFNTTLAKPFKWTYKGKPLAA